MHHARSVNGLERVGKSGAERAQLLPLQRAVSRNPLVEGVAADVPGDDVRPVTVGVGAEERGDAGCSTRRNVLTSRASRALATGSCAT